MKKVSMYLGIVSVYIILSGCFGEQPAELMYENLEESVEIENSIEEKQEPLVEAEQRELDLYDDMLELSSVEEIEPLADEAIESAESRLGIMEEERALIDESFEVFQQAEEHLEDIDEEETRAAADYLIDIMYERYDLYQELYNDYTASIDEDISLYNMMKDEDAEQEELQEQHETVNEYYNRITELNEQFNSLTNEYNDAKMDFYESAELNVTAG